MIVPKRLLAIALVAIVVVAVFAFFIWPILSPASVLSTSITIMDPQGNPHTVYAPNLLAFVSANGVQISSAVITTSFIAQSPNYNAFTLVSGTSPVVLTQSTGAITSKGTAWAVSLLYNFGGGLIGTCGSSLNPFTAGSAQYATKTNYYLGGGVGTTNTPTYSVNAQTLLAWASANGCPGIGSFTLAYSVQVTLQAVGTGSVPSATYAALYNVPLIVATGTLTVSGSTWGTTQ